MTVVSKSQQDHFILQEKTRVKKEPLVQRVRQIFLCVYRKLKYLIPVFNNLYFAKDLVHFIATLRNSMLVIDGVIQARINGEEEFFNA